MADKPIPNQRSVATCSDSSCTALRTATNHDSGSCSDACGSGRIVGYDAEARATISAVIEVATALSPDVPRSSPITTFDKSVVMKPRECPA